MDLLAGYGSDDGDSGDEQSPPREAVTSASAPAQPSVGGSLARLLPPQQDDAAQRASGGLFAKLPPPGSSVIGGFSDAGLSAAGFGLAPGAGAKPPPKPKPAAKKVVKLHTLKPLAPGDSDEVPFCLMWEHTETHRRSGQVVLGA